MEMVQKRRQMINLGVYNCTQNTSLIMYQLNAKWMFIFYFSNEKQKKMAVDIWTTSLQVRSLFSSVQFSLL